MKSGELDYRTLARNRLAWLLSLEGDFDMVEGAMWIAAEEYPDIEVQREVSRVRFISAEGARLVETEANPFARLDGLRRYLFEDLGYRGNTRHYNDPRNSYLNEVLNRRIGIPLTLSIIFMETARAAGFEVRGINLPGHFILRLSLGGRTILTDPYHRGRIITEEDCRQLVSKTTGRPSLYRREVLEGIDERGMIGRMLLNLKHVYIGLSDDARALAAVERLLLIKPGDPSEIRDRGLLKARQGLLGPAITDLKSYLSTSPHAPDASSVRGRLTWLRQRLYERN